MLQYRKNKITTAVLAVLVSSGVALQAQVELTETENFSTGFDAAEGYSSGYLQSDPNWSIDGTSYPLIGAFGVSSSLGVDLDQDGAMSIDFTSQSLSTVGWIDIQIKPTFGPSDDLPVNFPLGQAVLTGFVKVGVDGAVYALDGDGQGNGVWMDTGYSVSLSGDVAANWIRMTYRLDYANLKWDLFMDNQLQVINLGFVDPNTPPLSGFSIKGASHGSTVFDEFEAGFLNPLYSDSDNDGMSDSYESTQGLNSTLDDRLGDLDQDTLRNIEEFMSGTDAGNSDSDGDGIHDGLELSSGGDPLFDDGYALTALPYAEDFELLIQGSIDGQGQWQSGSGFAQVSSAQASSGVQSLEIAGVAEMSLDLRQHFDGKAEVGVWTDFQMKPAVFGQGESFDPSEINPQTSVVFYFKEPGYLVVFNGATKVFEELAVDFDASEWQRITLYQDYSSQLWSIWCDGLLVAADLGFANPQPYFSRIGLHQEADTAAYMDDLKVGAVKPLELDSDLDGIFDELEDLNLNGVVDSGETDPFNADTDNDGLIDSIESSYGLNPTVADAIVAELIEEESGVFTWQTSFEFSEGYVESSLDGQNGWASSGAVVAPEESVELAQSSSVESYLEHLIGVGLLQKLWVQFDAKLVVGELPDVAALNLNAALYWGFSSANTLSVWNETSQSWEDFPAYSSGSEWAKYSAYLDYSEGTWMLCQNGVIVAENLPLSAGRGKTLSRLKAYQESIDPEATAQVALFDNVLVSTTEPPGLDFDGDGLPNEWERDEGFDPNDSSDSLLDEDGDGLSNFEEYQLGTDYKLSDNDGDSLLDGFEISIGFDPMDPTDALLDTDSDTMPDWWEIVYALDRDDPADAMNDNDRDGLDNAGEYVAGTVPSDYDTDDDGYIDGWELGRGYDALAASSKPTDFDHDGVSNHDEEFYETDPADIESYEPLELFSQDFDDASFLLLEQGDAPLKSDGMLLVSGFAGSGVSGSATSAVLSYQSEGNFSAEDGSIAFWYQPDWNSGEQISNDSDLLPWFGLVEVGEWQLKYTPAYLGVVVHRNTRQIGVVLHDGTKNSLGGKHVEYFTPIRWKQGEWHHIVLTYEKDRIRFYVDSILQFEKERPVFTGFANPIRIPARNTGVVDDLRIYNYELSADERELFVEADNDNDALWDQFEYNSFGSLDVTDDLTGDNDGDGVNNRYESEARTNGNSADTDGDGLSDFDEILLEKGDPLDEDTDGDGILDGIEDALAGFDVFNADTDGDGINDYVEYLAVAEQATLATAELADSKIGTDTVLREGAWIEMENKLCPVIERGRAVYEMTVPEDGIYLLEVNAYQNNSVFSYVKYDLEQIREVTLLIDGQALGDVSFNHAYGHDSVERVYTQWLTAGTHQVELYFSEVLFSDPVFAIETLNLFKLPGVDGDNDGVLDWQTSLMAKFNLMDDATSAFYSPVHLRGQSRIKDDLPTTSVGTVEALWENQWYLSMPLAIDGSGTPVSLGFDSGVFQLDHVVAWEPLDLLAYEPDTISLPVGTSIRVAVNNPAEPAAIKNVNLNGIVLTETNGYFESAFSSAGTYVLIGSQGAVSKTVTIHVYDNIPSVIDDPRRAREDQDFALGSLHDGLAFEAHDRISYGGTTASGTLTVESFDAFDTTVAYSDQFAVAAPVLKTERLSFFDLETVQITYMRAIEELEDGTIVVQNKIMGYNLPSNIKIVLDIFASGVTFEDGSTYREVTTADFDEFGVYTYVIWLPPGNSSAGCHRKKLYLGNTYLGNVNR